MRKLLSFAALALSSGAAVVSAAGAAQANEHGTTWCAAPTTHAERVDAACISRHDSIHVGMWDTDLKSDWCIGAFAAWAPFATSPAMACDSDHHPTTWHPPVPGPPPTGNPHCDDHCPPPVMTPPPCPMPPPPVVTPPPCPPVMTPPPCPMPPPPVVTPPPCPMPPPPVVTPPPCPPVMTPPPCPEPCPPGGDDHHWAASPETGHTTAGLPIVGSALGGLL